MPEERKIKMANKSKQFENQFKSDWLNTFPTSFIYRLNDQMSGYKESSTNICDFICYNKSNLYLIECKSHKGASIPFEAIPQYEKLTYKVGIPGVRAGVILWLYEKDLVLYIPIATITEIMKTGKKSVGIVDIKKGYNIKVIPSKKLRVFMESDYSVLLDLQEGE